MRKLSVLDGIIIFIIFVIIDAYLIQSLPIHRLFKYILEVAALPFVVKGYIELTKPRR